jgi:cysteine desulfurase/selenocysteine lyase
MIRKVTLEKTTWADVPARFEAGTPSVGDVVALGVALDYLSRIGLDAVWAHEHALVSYALQRLADVPGLVLHGPGRDVARAGVVSFSLGEIHPHDVAAILDEQNIAVRAGHHCCQPVMHALGLGSTTRASFYIYNTHDDVDRLVDGLIGVRRVFGVA